MLQIWWRMCLRTVRREEDDRGCVVVEGPFGLDSSARSVLGLDTWLRNAIIDTIVTSHLRCNLHCKIRCRTSTPAIVAGLLNQTLDLGFLTLVNSIMGLIKLIVLQVKIALGLVKIHMMVVKIGVLKGVQ